MILYFNGCASHARKCILALDNYGAHLSIDPFGMDKQFAEQLSPAELERWRRLLNQTPNGGCYICFAVPTLFDGTDVYAHARQHSPGFDNYIGITTFETDRMPYSWVKTCNEMDEIWVPSTFNREAFGLTGIDPRRLHVFPTGVDTEILSPARVQPMEIQGRRGFTFLSVFQWTKRKGWDVLLKAYFSAFTPKDDVCLVLRTYPHLNKFPPVRERINRFISQLGHDPGQVPPIILIDEFVQEDRMPSLYAAADAFVLPTRGEGFGLPFMEAMAMGLPVIATRWSGHLDFMKDDNSYLIDIEGLVPMDPEQMAESPFYTPDHKWARPSTAHTAFLMRHVYEHREEARLKGRIAREHIKNHWHPRRSAEWIMNRVACLAEAKRARKTVPSPAAPRSHQATAPHPYSKIDSPALIWHAPILHPGDYADEARRLISHIAPYWRVRIEPRGRISDTFATGMDAAERADLLGLMKTDLESPYIRLFHGPADTLQRDPGAILNIARTMSETDLIPPDWVERCNTMDELWVPSAFNEEGFRRAGVTVPVHIVPAGVDSRFFRPGLPPFRIPGRRRFAFLSIFEWTYQKGWDLLLRAWADAFKPEDDVCLILRSFEEGLMDRPALQAEMQQSRITDFITRSLNRSTADVAPVIVLSQQLPYCDLPRLYAAADAFVLPSRGETWGRHYIEAMSCGLPVIGTRWGGNLSFMNDENSYLIDIEGSSEANSQPESPSHGGLSLSSPSVEHLKSLMRNVFHNPEHARRIGEKARKDVAEPWSWELAAQAALNRLMELRKARLGSGLR